MVRQADLIKCQYLKVGAQVEFECHADKKGLVAKKVKLINQNKKGGNQNGGNQRNGSGKTQSREPYFGVMTQPYYNINCNKVYCGLLHTN